jgi:diguanylate cyclase (GGDEF)-like protein
MQKVKNPSDCTILIVDDEKVICELLSSALKGRYRVYTCYSGTDAVNMIDSMYFDVVISDLKLPGLSGIEVIRHAKEKDDFTEVMIITGYASLESATSAINIGVSAYLTKPLSLSGLQLQVEKAVATRLFHLKSIAYMDESDNLEPNVKDHLYNMTSLYYFSRKLMLPLEIPEILRIVLHGLNERMHASFSIIALRYLNYSEIAAIPRYGSMDESYTRRVILNNWDEGFFVFNRELFDKNEPQLSLSKGLTGSFEPVVDIKPTVVLLSLMGQNIGSLLIFRPESIADNSAEAQFLHVFSSFVSGVIEHGYIDMQAKIQARTDGLTGIANHRSFHELLSREIARADRKKSEFAFVIMDIDDFKHINDNYGHLVGDAVIRDLTEKVGLMIRKGDTFARQGGEEFSLILPDTSMDGALILANRVCDRISSSPFIFSDVNIGYTVSMGLTIYSGKKNISKDALIALADGALYRAKKSGKNRVCTHPPRL